MTLIEGEGEMSFFGTKWGSLSGRWVPHGSRAEPREHLAVEELVPDGAPRFQELALLFAPVHLSRGARYHGVTLSDVEAALSLSVKALESA